MNEIYAYDLFVSYATQNKEVAEHIVDRLEKRHIKCFIAPRDIKTGCSYASEIVKAISNSLAVLLVYSSASDKSGFVLREVNSAVSRNKTLIPLRIEDFLPSEAMEFYLGPTHWLDAFPIVLDTHLNSICSIIKGLSGVNTTPQESNSGDYTIKGPELISLSQVLSIGYDHKKLTMREIELDYLCIPQDKYIMNEDIEGTIEDWQNATKEYEEDTSVLLVKNDNVIGYCDLYPLSEEGYETVISGKAIVRENMIDVYTLGGEFNAYVAMLSIEPEHASQDNYLLFFKWMANKLNEWLAKGIVIKELGISVYSSMLEKFLEKFGFTFVGLNPARGKIYKADAEKFFANEAIKRLTAR